MPHFVVVEDDHLQEGPIADNLAGLFPDAVVEAFAPRSSSGPICHGCARRFPISWSWT